MKISASCWHEGDIIASEFDKQSGIFTAEECQYQCKMNESCEYFAFNERSNLCKMFDGSAENKYKRHELILFGPKDCPGKYHD